MFTQNYIHFHATHSKTFGQQKTDKFAWHPQKTATQKLRKRKKCSFSFLWKEKAEKMCLLEMIMQ